MATLLISKEGKYRAFIREISNGIDDGYNYKVDVTDKVFDSQRKAIRNARTWLKKKRQKYYRKHPKKRIRIRTKRIIPKVVTTKKLNPVINKLYKMKKETAAILVKMSGDKLKIHSAYAKEKWGNKKVTALSGNTSDFNTAIYTVMRIGTKKERKAVAKFLKKFNHEQVKSKKLNSINNIFY